MSIEHADLPFAAVQFRRESPWRSEAAHDHRYDRVGQLADHGTAVIAPPRDPGRSERRRYRSDDRAGSKGSRAAAWMRIVLDTNVSVSAVLKLNSPPFLAVRWIDQRTAACPSPP
jgi:hypothetical protein